MTVRYAFIDGAFLQSFLDAMIKELSHDILNPEIDWAQLGKSYDRVFFYDAYPTKKSSQSEDNFNSIYREKDSYFDNIAKTPNFSVRPALTRRGLKAEQKGVDVLLAIECMAHAFRKNIDEAVIMTSDLDFFPLFEYLLQTNTRSILLYDLRKTSNDLIRMADRSEPLTGYTVKDWLPARFANYTKPRGVSSQEQVGNTSIKIGTIDGKKLELWKIEKDQYYYATLGDAVIGSPWKARIFVEGDVETRLKSPISWHAPPTSTQASA